MTSNANPRPETPATKVAPSGARGSAPAPAAVPISLYREVASELQTTKSDLNSVKTENQHLVQQNQQLRLEIERVVQSTLHLRQLADHYRTGQGTLESFPSHLDRMEVNSSEIASSPVQAAMNNSTSDPAEAAAKLVPPAAKVVTSQAGQPHPVSLETADNSPEISTWWLVLVVCLIVVSAFGMGFFIVRPLLPSR